MIPRGVTHRDPHALKFAEACTREHACGPAAVYLQAADHVINSMTHW